MRRSVRLVLRIRLLLAVGRALGRRRRRLLELEVVVDDGKGLAGDVDFENAVSAGLIEIAGYRTDGEGTVMDSDAGSVERGLNVGLGRERRRGENAALLGDER